jgi:uncharacterized protein
MKIIRTLLTFLLFAFVHAALAADVPMLTGRIVDNAELMTPATRASLTAKLKAHEDKTGNQVVVLTIPTLGEESVDAYGVRVVEQWKIGKKGKDNGVLLLVVPKEKKIRIEVGYGLEGALPDAVASRIIRNVIAPPFKAGQFDQGMEAGVTAIIGALEGDAAATPADKPEKSASGFQEPNMSLSDKLLFGAFIFGIIGLFTVIGLFTPGMGWFLYFFLIPFWGLFPIAIVGLKTAMVILGVYVIGFPIAKLLIQRSEWFKKRNALSGDRRGRNRSRYDGVSHSSGSWSSSSSSSSWGSSDSFSGGGGSSGDW